MARFRIIAGPNGSGKSTLVQRIANEVNIGYLLNADTVQQEQYRHWTLAIGQL